MQVMDAGLKGKTSSRDLNAETNVDRDLPNVLMSYPVSFAVAWELAPVHREQCYKTKT
jgi:hypothetical protein